jgi:hypothetical protein
MMEFFLSKVWLFACGIAVTGVLVLAFSGLGNSVADDESQRRVEQMADALDSVSDSPDSVHMTVRVADYLPDGKSHLLMSAGYIGIESGGERKYAMLHSSIVLNDNNGTSWDSITLVYGDVLLVTKDPASKGVIWVQVAKERTVSLID